MTKKPIDWIHIKGVKDWTPTENIIFDFESGLFNALKNFHPINDSEESDLYYILKELPNYKRQYIGFLDSINNKCLWINFHKSKFQLKEPEQRIVTVLGGGSDYFTIWFNLTDNKIIKLLTNDPI